MYVVHTMFDVSDPRRIEDSDVTAGLKT